eukprot:9059474-Pyramimonas_sp.AAC.1
MGPNRLIDNLADANLARGVDEGRGTGGGQREIGEPPKTCKTTSTLMVDVPRMISLPRFRTRGAPCRVGLAGKNEVHVRRSARWDSE